MAMVAKIITKTTFVLREQMRYIKLRSPIDKRKKAKLEVKPELAAAAAGSEGS
jgi:hypothetical protein